MLKKLFMIFLLSIIHWLLLISNCYSQQPTQEWVRRYTDTSSASWSAKYIKSDSAGFIYVLAETSNDFGFLKYSPGGNLLIIATHWPGGYDNGGGSFFDVTANGDVYITGEVSINFNSWMYTVKFNSSGVFQWGKFYNPDTDDGPRDIKVDKAGNVIVAGGAAIGNSGFGLIIKYNPIGDTLWIQKYRLSSQSTVCHKIALDDLNNIYITGTIGNKCFTSKHNPAGNLVWFTPFTFDSVRTNIGGGITLDMNGNIYIAGTQVTPPFADIHDYLLKLNNGGVIQWNRMSTGISNGGYMAGPVVSMDGGSIYYITMLVNGTGGGGYSLATLKYNSAGDSQWINMFYGGVPGTGNFPGNIKLDRYSNVYVCGTGNYPTTGDDFVTIKYTPAGVQQWVAQYSGVINAGDYANDLFIDTSLNVYVVGDSKNQFGTYDAVTIKYSQPNGIQQISSNIPAHFRLEQNYPNPFNPNTVIKFQVSGLPSNVSIGGFKFIKLGIYDVLGREITTLVTQGLRPGIYSVDWDASNYPSGVYFYRLTAADYTDTKKMILIK
jgi:hypothetical protein